MSNFLFIFVSFLGRNRLPYVTDTNYKVQLSNLEQRCSQKLQSYRVQKSFCEKKLRRRATGVSWNTYEHWGFVLGAMGQKWALTITNEPEIWLIINLPLMKIWLSSATKIFALNSFIHDMLAFSVSLPLILLASSGAALPQIQRSNETLLHKWQSCLPVQLQACSQYGCKAASY